MNKLCSSARIVVENVIAGMKRYHIVKDLLRLRKSGIYDRVMEIACGLHNLRVSCRQSQEPLDLFDLVSFTYCR